MAAQIGVSATTIRRDLNDLAKAGVLRRVHGGAHAMPEQGDDPFQIVATVNTEAKDAIAARCAALVKDDQIVILDIGTTAARIASALRGRRLTIVTSSLAVVDILAQEPDIELIVLGGLLRRDYRSLVGYLTEDALRQIRADVLFLGCSGIRRNGDVMDTTVVEVPIKRAMIDASDSVILAGDASKFPGHGAARVASARSLDAVVTTKGLDPGTRAALQAAKVRIHEV